MTCDFDVCHGSTIILFFAKLRCCRRRPRALKAAACACAQGKLRIGLAEQTVLAALAQAVLLQRGGEQERSNRDGGLAGRLAAAEQAVKLAYSQCPSYDLLVPALLEHPVMARPLRPAAAEGWVCTSPSALPQLRPAGACAARAPCVVRRSHSPLRWIAVALCMACSQSTMCDLLGLALLVHVVMVPADAQEINKHVGFQPGVPVKPMLAKPTNGVSEVPRPGRLARHVVRCVRGGVVVAVVDIEWGLAMLRLIRSWDFNEVCAAQPCLYLGVHWLQQVAEVEDFLHFSGPMRN